MKIHCLKVDVFRNHFGDCSNNGISKYFNELLLACPDGPDTFDSEKETPINFCMIERRRFSFSDAEHLNIVPACVDASGRVVKRPGWWMNGGNIANACDSRFSKLCGHYYPLAIHDRQE